MDQSTLAEPSSNGELFRAALTKDDCVGLHETTCGCGFSRLEMSNTGLRGGISSACRFRQQNEQRQPVLEFVRTTLRTLRFREQQRYNTRNELKNRALGKRRKFARAKGYAGEKHHEDCPAPDSVRLHAAHNISPRLLDVYKRHGRAIHPCNPSDHFRNIRSCSATIGTCYGQHRKNSPIFERQNKPRHLLVVLHEVGLCPI